MHKVYYCAGPAEVTIDSEGRITVMRTIHEIYYMGGSVTHATDEDRARWALEDEYGDSGWYGDDL